MLNFNSKFNFKISEPFPLRPHHGLCIAFFEGKGYDENFTAHMRDCIRLLEEQNPSVRLVCSVDQICSHCPHRRELLCDSECKVQRYDRALLALCDLEESGILSWETFRGIVREKILETRNIAEVCTGCQWLGICENSQKAKFLI